MTRINTNVGSLRGMRSLAKSDKMLSTAMQRLSTGVKINNGKDNPSGLIAGETLRSQVATIEQSIVNSNRANNVLTTADGALGEIGGLLTQVRGLVQEGLNDGALSTEERDANQLQIDNALTAINRISSNTSFAGDKLLDGSKAFTTAISTADKAKLADVSVNQALPGATGGSLALNAEITAEAETASLQVNTVETSADTVLELQGSEGREVLQFGAGAGIDDIATAVNAVSDATGVTASRQTGFQYDVAASGGAEDASLVFNDVREDKSAGALNVVIADSGNAAGGAAAAAFDAGTNTVTITADQDVTLDGIAAAITGEASLDGLLESFAGGDSGNALAGTLASTALADGGGTLTLDSAGFGSDQIVELNVLEGSLATATAEDSSVSAVRDAGKDIEASINGQKAIGRGLTASVKTSLLDASLTFETANNVEGETASVNITGGGATFQIGQDVSASGQIGIGIDAVNTARLGGGSGKLYELASGGGKSLSEIADGSASGADAVDVIESAINEVSTLRGRIGAVQKNVIDTNINTLGVALENISEARSQIVDTDFAVESANLTKAQILGQAATSVLGIANQSPPAGAVAAGLNERLKAES